jgi:putative copper export protein
VSTLDTVRLFVHVLAACVWVGGQLVLGALVPTLRAAGPDVPAAAARAFNRVAWPAFWVLVATGIWNVLAVDVNQTALGLKLVAVAMSGVTAWQHARATTPRARGMYGAQTAFFALLALLLGVILAG